MSVHCSPRPIVFTNLGNRCVSMDVSVLFASPLWSARGLSASLHRTKQIAQDQMGRPAGDALSVNEILGVLCGRESLRASFVWMIRMYFPVCINKISTIPSQIFQTNIKGAFGRLGAPWLASTEKFSTCLVAWPRPRCCTNWVLKHPQA
jgi:hypothetical protein